MRFLLRFSGPLMVCGVLVTCIQGYAVAARPSWALEPGKEPWKEQASRASEHATHSNGESRHGELPLVPTSMEHGAYRALGAAMHVAQLPHYATAVATPGSGLPPPSLIGRSATS